MYKMDNLKEKTVPDLRNIAKQLEIKGLWDMNKAALMLAIASKTKPEKSESTDLEKEVVKEEKPFIDGEKIKENKINEAVKGTLVAYKDVFGNVKSAAIESRNKKARKLKLKTKYGQEFIVKYEDIVWVKDRKWWPKKVYMAFKKLTEEEYNARANNKKSE